MKVWMRGRLRVAHRLPAAVDVVEAGAGEAADHRVRATCWRSRLTASKSPSEAMGKPASMMSTPISSRSVGDLQLLVERHRGAGRLLAVAQRGVEDQDAVLFGCGSVMAIWSLD